MEIKKGFYAMGKKLDLNKTVYDLVQEYPELVDILKELGFSEITKTAMLHRSCISHIAECPAAVYCG